VLAYPVSDLSTRHRARLLAKLFSFRFDVDTHRCVREGMPALSALGARLGVPFTFFVNMGRSVSRRTVLARATSGNGHAAAGAAKLTPREKLGWRGYLEAAVLNPLVGGGSQGVLRAAADAGHEIGLHGGRNHGVWQHGAHAWSRERLAQEIDAVLPALSRAIGGRRPRGFASPGWTTSPLLPEVLVERGFHYYADLHGPSPSVAPRPKRADGGADAGAAPGAELPNVRTELTGEPGGVAYLEHLRAIGLDDDAVLSRFEQDLERAGAVAVAYDHPYYAGVRDLTQVERCVRAAQAAGYEVVALETIATSGAR